MKAFLFLIAATLLMCAITSAVPSQAAYHPPGFGVENVVHYDIVAIDQAPAELSDAYEFVTPVQPISLQSPKGDFNFRTDYWLPPGEADITGPAFIKNSWRWDESSITDNTTLARSWPVLSCRMAITSVKSLPPLHIEFG